MIPHEEYSIVGTTDTPYSGSPDSVYATAEDIRYLISEVERVFETTLSGDDIYATFVGLRPLANTDQSTPGAISRDHQIVTHSSRLLSIVGGKYTTFRSMSEHMAKAVMERLGKPMRDSTVTIKLPMNKYPTNESRLADIPGSVRYAVQHEFARHVMDYMRRRTHAFFRKGNGLDIVDAVARELGEVLNWSQTQIAAESDHYREVVEAMHLEIRAAVK
ncbi:hypothetical protein EBR96_01100 [bacterium]|nr:hypothetical protein [bacterium]